MPLLPGEQEGSSGSVRSLGCYPLSGAVESRAMTLEHIIAEMRAARLGGQAG